MTVGELRKLLATFPENAEVLVPLPIRGEMTVMSMKLSHADWQHLAIAADKPNVPVFTPGNAGPGSHVALHGEMEIHHPPGGY